MSLSITSAFAVDAYADVEWLQAGPDVVREYCATASYQMSSDCVVPNGDVAIVSFPDRFAKAVHSHTQAAFSAKYFDQISFDDLFHGHLILGGATTHYRNPAELLSDVTVILYHSAEYTNRWLNGDERPRSYLGWMGENPHIQPAIDFVGPKGVIASYEKSGTIYADQIVEKDPALSKLHWKGFGGHEDVTLNLCQGSVCRDCEVETMFFIKPPDGQKIYLRCEFPPSDGTPLSHASQPRPSQMASSK